MKRNERGNRLYILFVIIFVVVKFFVPILHECLLIVQTEILCDDKYGVCFSFVKAFSTQIKVDERAASSERMGKRVSE